MSIIAFEALRAELSALRETISAHTKKTVRDESLRDRFRSLFRSWVSSAKPTIEPLLKNKKEFFKLSAELEKIAQLTSKYKPVSEYHKRLNRAITLVDSLVLYLPPIETEGPLQPIAGNRGLFLPGIPDLPFHLVPNSIVGWRNKIETFLSTFPFDKSVFIMIKYRRRNNRLVTSIKKELSKKGLAGILASEHNLTDDLYNPITCLLACSKGIAVFDKAEAVQKFNPNVAYELGMLHLLGRECLILKHESLKSLHADILMKLYVDYSSASDVEEKVRTWIDSL